MVFRRLAGEDVQRRTSEMSVAERLAQRVLVHEAAARGVDQQGTLAHPFQALAVDQVARLVVQHRMQRHDLALSQQPLEAGLLDRCSEVTERRDVVCQHPAGEGREQPREIATHMTEADDPDGPARQRLTLHLAPLALARHAGDRRQVAQQRQHEGQHQLGDGACIGAARPGEPHVVALHRVEVEHVDADAHLRDRPQLW